MSETTGPNSGSDRGSSVQFSAAQDGIYALWKAHIRSTPSLRSLPNVILSIAMQQIYIYIWGGRSGGGGGGGLPRFRAPHGSVMLVRSLQTKSRKSRDVFDTFAIHPDLVHDVSDRLLATTISTPGRVFAPYKPWFLTNGKRNRAKNCCVSIFWIRLRLSFSLKINKY